VSSKARSKDLSPRQRQVLATQFSGPASIAQRAAIRTTPPRATAAKYCAEFVRLGLAEKSGTRWSPSGAGRKKEQAEAPTIDSMTAKNRIMIFGPKDDGTYLVEFRTAAGEALAISIPRSETAVIRHFQERMPYGLFVLQWWASGLEALSGFNRFVTARRVSLRASDLSESDMQRIPQCGEPRPVFLLAGASLFAFSR